MTAAVTAFVLSFLVSFTFIPVIIRIAVAKRLFDEPDVRKVHTRPISSLGGVGIFAGFIFALLLTTPATGFGQLPYYAAASLIIFFLGLKDDIMVIKPLRKLIGQLLAAGLLIHGAGVQLDSMQGFLNVATVPVWVGIPATYFIIILIINACNLIDGIDGLAGMLGTTISMTLGVYFLACKQPTEAILAFGLSGGLAAFLFFNMQPARIFMGDGGSMLIGLIMSVLVIRLIEIAPQQAALPLPAAPAVAFGALLLPLMDTLRVFSIRLLQGRSPFSPDKNHIHHLLLRMKWSHRKIAIVLTLVNAGFMAMGFALSTLDVNLVFLILAGIFFLAMGLLSRTVASHAVVTPAAGGMMTPPAAPRTTVLRGGNVVADKN